MIITRDTIQAGNITLRTSAVTGASVIEYQPHRQLVVSLTLLVAFCGLAGTGYGLMLTGLGLTEHPPVLWPLVAVAGAACTWAAIKLLPRAYLVQLQTVGGPVALYTTPRLADAVSVRDRVLTSVD